jgi:hypothetical protein
MQWRWVPWTLWAYSAFTLVSVILIEAEVHGPVAPKVLFPFVMFAWLFFLLKGVRWLWIVTVALLVLGFADELVTGSLTWRGTASGLIGLVLLLLPVTRRHFGSRAALASA